MANNINNWSDAEKEIVVSNYRKITYQQMEALLPGRVWWNIRSAANRLGITQGNARTYSFNENYFKLLTEESCYWAGFIAADGNIRKDFGALTIQLHTKDIGILESFIKSIGYNNTIKHRTQGVKTSVAICVYSKNMCMDLFNTFNITPQKSLTLKPPSISKEKHIAAFIKGFIDGNGSICSDRITIYGTKFILEWIKTYFDRWAPLLYEKRAPSVVNQVQRYLYAYKVGGIRKDRIFKMFSKLKCYKLKRKWDR